MCSDLEKLEADIGHTEAVIAKLENELVWTPGNALCRDCLNDHVQLLKWLKELRDYKRKDQDKGGEQC